MNGNPTPTVEERIQVPSYCKPIIPSIKFTFIPVISNSISKRKFQGSMTSRFPGLEKTARVCVRTNIQLYPAQIPLVRVPNYSDACKLPHAQSINQSVCSGQVEVRSTLEPKRICTPCLGSLGEADACMLRFREKSRASSRIPTWNHGTVISG